MKMRIFFQQRVKLVLILMVCFVFSSCASFGTRTLSRTNNLSSYHFSKLGYSQLASEELINKIRPNTSNIFQLAINEFFADKTIRIEKHNLTTFELIDKIDTIEIAKICYENSLDGYLCTQLKYKFVDNYYMNIPLGKSEDAYIEIKLFDNKGKLILHTKHNTFMGNSYMMAPKAEQTVRDGTFGALKQILKELKHNNG
jgi:hypothetical protein